MERRLCGSDAGRWTALKLHNSQCSGVHGSFEGPLSGVGFTDRNSIQLHPGASDIAATCLEFGQGYVTSRGHSSAWSMSGLMVEIIVARPASSMGFRGWPAEFPDT